MSCYRTPIARKHWTLRSFDSAGNLVGATPRTKVSMGRSSFNEKREEKVGEVPLPL